MEGWEDKADCPNGPSGQQDEGQSEKRLKFEVGSATCVRLGQLELSSTQHSSFSGDLLFSGRKS